MTESVCKIEETKDVLSFVAIGASKIDSIGLFTAVLLCKSIFCLVFRKILQALHLSLKLKSFFN